MALSARMLKVGDTHEADIVNNLIEGTLDRIQTDAKEKKHPKKPMNR